MENNTKNTRDKAILSARPMMEEELITLFKYIENFIIPEFGIDRSAISPLGSYCKKGSELYGDLDIAISSYDLEMANDLLPDEVPDFLALFFSAMGLETKVMSGFNQVTVGFPIENNGIGQVDFMISPSIEWSKFIYNSPDFSKGESKYKGFYRNQLLMAIITEVYKEILIEGPDGVEELESYVVRMPEGIWVSRRSFKGKKGLVKTPKLLKEFDRFITMDVEETVKLVVGEGYISDDISTFEKLFNIVEDPGFVHLKYRGDIMKKFIQNLDRIGAEYPEEVSDFIKIKK